MAQYTLGSPPLARGTVKTAIALKAQGGITPACAGNSHGLVTKLPPRKDHPRLRGEQITETLRDGDFVGSPPLARGTDNVAKCPPPAGGITPACAGNSWGGITAPPRRWDHPRLRGEQPLQPPLWPCHIGSPPLARGTVPQIASNRSNRGITPACAGNSLLIHFVALQA